MGGCGVGGCGVYPWSEESDVCVFHSIMLFCCVLNLVHN